jgi:HPr kinase/phosphorylase
LSKVTVHGTAVLVGDCGVLIRGIPGSGKSSLALRLIDSAGYGVGAALMRAKLIADDQVELESRGGAIAMAAPKRLAGILEIRGYGIVQLAHTTGIALGLVVDLTDLAIQRMPEEKALQTTILGVTIQALPINAADPAAAAKIRVAVAKPSREA